MSGCGINGADEADGNWWFDTSQFDAYRFDGSDCFLYYYYGDYSMKYMGLSYRESGD